MKEWIKQHGDLIKGFIFGVTISGSLVGLYTLRAYKSGMAFGNGSANAFWKTIVGKEKFQEVLDALDIDSI